MHALCELESQQFRPFSPAPACPVVLQCHPSEDVLQDQATAPCGHRAQSWALIRDARLCEYGAMR